MDSLLWSLLGGVLFPLWLIAGLVDYWTHQRTGIAHTSGLPESLLHLAQALQIGVPVLIVLFLQINLLALAIITACVAAHTMTAYADIRYTNDRREIGPIEQVTHAFLITLPIFATMLVVVLHWGDLASTPVAAPSVTTGGSAVVNGVAATGDAGPVDPWTLGLRDPPWPLEVIVLVLAASLLFGLLPGLAELRQTASAAKGRPSG